LDADLGDAVALALEFDFDFALENVGVGRGICGGLRILRGARRVKPSADGL